MQLFDAHMHYSDTHGPAFDAVRERHGVGACTLACIPQMGVCSTVPDALYYKAVHPEGTVYVMGGLERSAWFLHEGDAAALGEDLVAQAGALLAAGCNGIKLLEGKPDIRRNFPIPDFDTPAWEPFWRWAEEQRVPILWHVNDPEEFWDASRINPYAKSEGWFYGPETINNEEQYRQVFAVLACHPGLRLQLAHLFFFSAQLPRLSALLRRYPEVRVDLTPGIELYTNLAGDIPAARAFFEEFGTRILYGSDIGSRAHRAAAPAAGQQRERRAGGRDPHVSGNAGE
ncbi:MAG: amidohydrolase family protein [Ruthenibacterium lactatiformans]